MEPRDLAEQVVALNLQDLMDRRWDNSKTLIRKAPLTFDTFLRHRAFRGCTFKITPSISKKFLLI